MTTQLQKYLVWATPFILLWIMLFSNYFDLAPAHRTLYVYTVPAVLVALFGAYAIFSVASGALSINNCVTASAELHREIAETQRDLKKRGVIE